jgi:hypothetical protein
MTTKLKPPHVSKPNRAAVAAFNFARRSRLIVDEWDKTVFPFVAVKTRTLFKHPAQ